jgi:hypothetical protein
MNILKEKQKITFSNAINKIFSLISFNGNYNISGSGNLRSILYPSDYDLIERVIKHETREKALNEIVKHFQNKFLMIKKNPKIFLIDFKCGLDELMYFDKFNDLKSYHIYLKKMYSEQLITKNEYLQMSKLTNPIDIKEATRKHYILRWTEDEIIKGYKIVSKNRKILLINCIMDNTVIKLDIIAHLAFSQFVDVSEIYIFKVNNQYNFIHTQKQIFQNVKQDAIQYLKEKNAYKALKRIFSLNKFNSNNQVLVRLVELFNSNVGLVNKIKNDFEIYKMVLDHTSHISIDEIKYGVQNSKQMLGNVYQFGINDIFFSEINSISKMNDKNKIIHEMDKIIDKLKLIVQKYTIIWLKKNQDILNILK